MAVSAQAGDVVRHGLDLAVIELGRHLGHLHAVLAAAVAEGGQLGGRVVGVLAGQARVLRGQAGTVGAVAAGAGGDLAVGKAADFVLLQAGDSVEAIRLRATRLMVVRRGEVVACTAPAKAVMSLPGRPVTVDFRLQR